MLARVERLGRHRTLHLPSGRRRTLIVGDEIVVSFGDRYASDQFEARVPGSLGPCHLVAAGGVAAEALSRHERLRGPTEIEALGFVCRSRMELP